MICKKCNFENYDGTKYCQKCGGSIPRKKPLFSFENGKFLAGWGGKGIITAPLIGMAVEGHANRYRDDKVHISTVPVIPLENGDWYCPECGQYNLKKDIFCKGCGRDI